MSDDVVQPNAQIDLSETEPEQKAAPTPAPVKPWTNVKLPDTTPAPASVEPEAKPEPPVVAKETPVSPPQPEPPVVEATQDKKAPKENDLESIIAEMKEERDRLRGLAEKQLNRERLLYLREIGAKGGINDGDLLMLAPKEDPTTAEGRAALDAWRERSNVYFDQRDPHATVDVEELAKGYKSSANGTFGANLAANILKAMGTKK